MTQVVANDAMIAKLAEADGPFDVYGPDGEYLGYITPIRPQRDGRVEPPSDDDVSPDHIR